MFTIRSIILITLLKTEGYNCENFYCCNPSRTFYVALFITHVDVPNTLGLLDTQTKDFQPGIYPFLK